jgi:hypothetical protein
MGRVEYNNDTLFKCMNCKKTWILSYFDSWLDELYESKKCILCERYTYLWNLKKEICPDCQDFIQKYKKYKPKLMEILKNEY